MALIMAVVMLVGIVGGGGTARASAPARHAWAGPAPRVKAVTPGSGPESGGTSVNISGTHFNRASAVDFATIPAASFTVNSSTSITAVSPVGVAGAIDITVINAKGKSSASSSADQFTYTQTLSQTPAQTPAPPPTGSLVFTPPPSQIPDDCSVDVGDTENSPSGSNGLLYDWLNSLPPGSPSNPVTVRFVPGGCYLVNGGIFVRNFRNYVFDGNGATFREDTPPAGRHPVLYNVDMPAADYCGDGTSYGRAATWTPLVPIVWWFVGGCDVTVENMTIQGPYGGSGGGGGSEQDSGIELSGVQRFTVTNNTIRNVSGDFVTVSGLWEGLVTYAGQPSTDVSIVNNTFSGAGRQGVTLGYVDRVLVTANTLTNVAATVFDIEIDTIWGNSDNIDITQNTVLGQTYAFLVAALTGTTMNNFAFTDNQMTDGAQMRVIMDPNGLNNATITGNVATDVDSSSAFMRPAIQLEDLIDGKNTAPETDILVANNTIPSSPWNHGDPIRGGPTVAAGSDVSNLQVRNNFMPLTYGWGVPHTYDQVLPLWQDGTSGPASSGASTFSGNPSNVACGNSQGSVGTIYYGAACGGAYAPPLLPSAPSSPVN